MRGARLPAFAAALLLFLFSAGAARGDEVEEGVARARAMMERGEIPACVEELTRLRERHSGDPRVLRMLAYVELEKQGKAEEAMEILEEALRRVPGDPYALGLLATICDRAYDQGRLGLSLESAKLLVELQPEEKENRLRWAWAAFRLGMDPGSVRSACREVISRFPSFDRAYLLLAHVYETEGEFEEAVDVYRSLLAEYPGDVYVRLMMAHRLLWDMREYDLAEDAFRSALEIAESGSAYRKDAEAGLRLVREQRERAGRLAARYGFLRTLLVGVLAGYGVVLAALSYLLRPK